MKKNPTLQSMSLKEKAEAALKEAVLAVIKERQQMGRPLIVWKDGQVIKMDSAKLPN